jgi:uncharacterized protein YqeY
MAPEANLQIRITEDIKLAMKSGDTVKRDTLRMLLSSVKNAANTKLAPLDESEVVAVVAKDVKRHMESIEAYEKGNRPDLVAKEKAEMVILQAYMPAQISREEITAVVKEIIAALGAKGPGDKGKVMQQVMPKLKGKAEGKDINEVVMQLLSQ